MELNPHEAVMAFAAWLTTRDEEITLSGHHNAAPVAEAVNAFAESQGLKPIRDDFGDRILPYPKGRRPDGERQ